MNTGKLFLRLGALAAVTGLTATLNTTGCSSTSTAPGPAEDASFDATSPSPGDASTPATDDGDSNDAIPGTDAAALDATITDGAIEGAAGEAGATDAASDGPGDAARDASGPDTGDAGSDAGDAGHDAGPLLDAGADGAAIDAGTPTFTAIYSGIITPSCLSCHGQPPPIESNLLMRTQHEAYTNLVNVVAAGDACSIPPADGGPLPIRVVPGDATDSLLYQKITNTQHCGSGMPLDSDPLDANKILAIKTWINQGAMDN